LAQLANLVEKLGDWKARFRSLGATQKLLSVAVALVIYYAEQLLAGSLGWTIEHMVQLQTIFAKLASPDNEAMAAKFVTLKRGTADHFRTHQAAASGEELKMNIANASPEFVSGAEFPKILASIMDEQVVELEEPLQTCVTMLLDAAKMQFAEVEEAVDASKLTMLLTRAKDTADRLAGAQKPYRIDVAAVEIVFDKGVRIAKQGGRLYEKGDGQIFRLAQLRLHRLGAQ
jgi:hypothetical protein